MQSYHVSVPVKAHIRKYFEAIYGTSISLSHASDFGDTLLTKFSSRPLSQVNKNVLNLFLKDCTDRLRFEVPADFYFRFDPDLSSQHIYNANRFLENTFKADLYNILNVAGCFNVEINTAIKAFVNKYGVDLGEDITLEGLKKSYYRYRQGSTAKNNFLLQMATASHISLRC